MTDLEAQKINEIVAFSGGKDSSCMAWFLEEKEPNQHRRFLYTPTGNELPEMKDHMNKMISYFGKDRFIILQPISLVDLINEQQCIPNYRMRFCTRIIKIEPCIEYLKNIDSPVLCVGLRHDEPLRKGLYDEYVTNRYPLREYGFNIRDVYQYLERKNIKIPERTDCAFCYYQRLIDWQRLWDNHPMLYAQAEMLEIRHGHTFRSPSKDNHPASLRELRVEFEKGWIPKYRKKRNESRGGCRVCSM